MLPFETIIVVAGTMFISSSLISSPSTRCFLSRSSSRTLLPCLHELDDLDHVFVTSTLRFTALSLSGGATGFVGDDAIATGELPLPLSLPTANQLLNQDDAVIVTPQPSTRTVCSGVSVLVGRSSLLLLVSISTSSLALSLVEFVVLALSISML